MGRDVCGYNCTTFVNVVTQRASLETRWQAQHEPPNQVASTSGRAAWRDPCPRVAYQLEGTEHSVPRTLLYSSVPPATPFHSAAGGTCNQRQTSAGDILELGPPGVFSRLRWAVA